VRGDSDQRADGMDEIVTRSVDDAQVEGIPAASGGLEHEAAQRDLGQRQWGPVRGRGAGRRQGTERAAGRDPKRAIRGRCTNPHDRKRAADRQMHHEIDAARRQGPYADSSGQRGTRHVDGKRSSPGSPRGIRRHARGESKREQDRRSCGARAPWAHQPLLQALAATTASSAPHLAARLNGRPPRTNLAAAPPAAP
jgi:hypothetical protein